MYGNPYSDEDELKTEKRTPMKEIDEGHYMPRYIQRRSNSARNNYWNLLKALEEQLALEEMSRQGVEDDGMLKMMYILITRTVNTFD